jgi:hypothetical protein
MVVLLVALSIVGVIWLIARLGFIVGLVMAIFFLIALASADTHGLLFTLIVLVILALVARYLADKRRQRL